MGTYNILQASITCPHCDTFVSAEIDMYFGNTLMMDTFIIGDQYKWLSGHAVKNGGRPPDGNLDGEGYTECSQCGWHYFVKVIVRGDRIEGVEPDREKPSYSPDSDVVSTPPLSDVTPIWKPKPRIRQIGQITYNEKWNLTSQIGDLLRELVKFGVDIYSTSGGSDYTILVPPDLSREQQDEVDRLMHKLGKEVNGKVDYVDWYPHGWKFRIEPQKGSRS